ncbi:hypothetical protein D1872_212870 [compost metagenome]
MKNISVHGTVNMAISLDIKAQEKEQGLHLAQYMLNSFSSNLDTVTFNFFDREPITVKIHDWNNTWQSAFDDED